MNPLSWSPEAWNSIGVVAVIILMAAFHFWAYMTGRLVPGKHLRDIVEARDRELAQANTRAKEDAESIRILATTVAENNAAQDVTARILATIREEQRK